MINTLVQTQGRKLKFIAFFALMLLTLGSALAVNTSTASAACSDHDIRFYRSSASAAGYAHTPHTHNRAFRWQVQDATPGSSGTVYDSGWVYKGTGGNILDRERFGASTFEPGHFYRVYFYYSSTACSGRVITSFHW